MKTFIICETNAIELKNEDKATPVNAHSKRGQQKHEQRFILFVQSVI